MSTSAEVRISSGDNDIITLKDLNNLVEEANSLGLDGDDTFLWINGQLVPGPIELVFVTTNVHPILCGDHAAYEDRMDVLVGTHEHKEDNE